MACASESECESLKKKKIATVNCAKFGGTYYGVVLVNPETYMLHSRNVAEGRVQQRYLLASQRPVNFTAEESKVLLSSDGGCHNLFVITDDETVSVLNHIFEEEHIAFAIGGVVGINLFQIDERLRCHRATWKICGHHEKFVELRPKFRANLNGQSTLHYSIA